MVFGHKQKSESLNNVIEVIDRDGSIIEVLIDPEKDERYSLLWWIRRWREEQEAGNREKAEQIRLLIHDKIIADLLSALVVVLKIVGYALAVPIVIALIAVAVAIVLAVLAVFVIGAILRYLFLKCREWWSDFSQDTKDAH